MLEPQAERLVELEDGFAKLMSCYEQLETVLAAETSESQTINGLIEQTEMLVNRLAELIEQNREFSVKERLTQSYQKSLHLIERINEEKAKILTKLSSLQTGKQAFNAYRRPQGMGYSEGKFLDQKK